MLAIDHIAVARPAGSVQLATDAAAFGLDPVRRRVLTTFMGLAEVPVAAAREEVPLLVRAVTDLLGRPGVDRSRITTLVHAHTGPYVGTAGLSVPRLLARLVGPRVSGHGTQLHKCVSAISALPMLDAVLATQPAGSYALLVIGESADSPDLRVLPTSVAGDVACAVLVSRDGPGDRVVAQSVTVHGQYAAGVYAPPGDPDARAYGLRFEDHLLEVVDTAARRAGITCDDIRYVLPHNVNVGAWRQVVARWGVPPERLFIGNVARYAHCFGADGFINLDAVRADLNPGDHCLMASAGVGGAFGAVVLRH